MALTGPDDPLKALATIVVETARHEEATKHLVHEAGERPDGTAETRPTDCAVRAVSHASQLMDWRDPAVYNLDALNCR